MTFLISSAEGAQLLWTCHGSCHEIARVTKCLVFFCFGLVVLFFFFVCSFLNSMLHQYLYKILVGWHCIGWNYSIYILCHYFQTFSILNKNLFQIKLPASRFKKQTRTTTKRLANPLASRLYVWELLNPEKFFCEYKQGWKKEKNNDKKTILKQYLKDHHQKKEKKHNNLFVWTFLKVLRWSHLIM